MTALLSIDESGNATTNALIHGLRDTESYGFSFAISVQRIASENLTLIAAKAQKATSTLIELLNKRETREAPWRYEETSYSLATLGIKDAAPLFQRDLKYERKNQSNYFFFFDRAIPESYESTCVRVSAAAALARLDPKNNEAVDYLLHVLEDDQWSVVAPSGAKGARLMDPRAIAATGLGLVGREARPALPALGRAMRKGREEQVDLSVKAAWAIARIDPVDRSCLSILKVAHFSNPTISEAPRSGQSRSSCRHSSLGLDRQRQPFDVKQIATAPGKIGVLVETFRIRSPEMGLSQEDAVRRIREVDEILAVVHVPFFPGDQLAASLKLATLAIYGC